MHNANDQLVQMKSSYTIQDSKHVITQQIVSAWPLQKSYKLISLTAGTDFFLSTFSNAIFDVLCSMRHHGGGCNISFQHRVVGEFASLQMLSRYWNCPQSLMAWVVKYSAHHHMGFLRMASIVQQHTSRCITNKPIHWTLSHAGHYFIPQLHAPQHSADVRMGTYKPCHSWEISS